MIVVTPAASQPSFIDTKTKIFTPEISNINPTSVTSVTTTLEEQAEANGEVNKAIETDVLDEEKGNDIDILDEDEDVSEEETFNAENASESIDIDTDIDSEEIGNEVSVEKFSDRFQQLKRGGKDKKDDDDENEDQRSLEEERQSAELSFKERLKVEWVGGSFSTCKNKEIMEQACPS